MDRYQRTADIRELAIRVKIMRLTCLTAILIFIVFPVRNSFASQDNFKCGGTNTVLSTNNSSAITICHGLPQKVDQNHLTKWNTCFDATILLHNKSTGENKILADCYPQSQKQFAVRGGKLYLRYYYTEYPGFEMKPLAVESLDPRSRKRSYKLEKTFKKCTRKEIEEQNRVIVDTLSKPFEGSTFFKDVYGAFFKLRDCSSSYPDRVLRLLNGYRRFEQVDGEVAETLDSVIDESELIRKAVKHKTTY